MKIISLTALGGLLGGNPWFWFTALVLFMLTEAMTVSAVSIWFAIGALVAFICSFFVQSAIVELLIFTTISLFSVLTLRQWALSKLHIGKVKTNIDELIGQEGVVTETISFPDGGRLKVKGNSWRCQSESNTCYEVGTSVTIRRIEGVTIYID